MEKLASITTQEEAVQQHQNLTLSAYLFVWYDLCFLPMKRYILSVSEVFKNSCYSHINNVGFYDRERESAPFTCALALVSMEQTAGLIILILQVLEDLILPQGMVMWGHLKVHHLLYPRGLLQKH